MTGRGREIGASSWPLVMLAGAGTVVLALAGVFAANRSGTNVMGWYANYILPVGALLVGLVAATGFAISSYLTGTKISGWILLTTVAILAASYFAAHYIEFRLLFPEGALDQDGRPVGFLRYFDELTRATAFEGRRGDRGSPLGPWGYAFRALELLGFVGGGVAVPLLLRRLPYCEACGLYMKTRDVARIPAGVAGKAVNPKKDPAAAAAREQSERQAHADAEAALARVRQAAAKDSTSLNAAIAAAGPLDRKKETDRLTARIWVRLVHCRRCHAGELRATVASGQGKQITWVQLPSSPADRQVVRDLAGRRG